MSVSVLRRKLWLLETVQWVGLLLAALVWTAQHVVGFGITQAACGPGGRGFGIDYDTWQIALMGVTAAIILVAEAAALIVVRLTSDSAYHGPPPIGRMRFFAIAAAVANVLFFLIVILDGLGTVYGIGCRQS